MINKKRKPITEPYHRNAICVILQDGYKLRISNRARQESKLRKKPVRPAQIVREIIEAFFNKFA